MIFRCYRLYHVTRPVVYSTDISRMREQSAFFVVQRGATGALTRSVFRDLDEAADQRHTVGFLMKWYVLAVVACQLFNVVWDVVRIIPHANKAVAFDVQIVAYAISGGFYFVVFSLCLYYLRHVSDYYKQTTELAVLSLACLATRAAIVYHAVLSLHAQRVTSLAPTLMIVASLFFVVLVSAVVPVLQSVVASCAAPERVFPELGVDTERNPLIDARLRSHAVAQVVSLVPRDV